MWKESCSLENRLYTYFILITSPRFNSASNNLIEIIFKQIFAVCRAAAHTQHKSCSWTGAVFITCVYASSTPFKTVLFMRRRPLITSDQMYSNGCRFALHQYELFDFYKFQENYLVRSRYLQHTFMIIN